MEELEATSWVFGVLVALLTLLTSVWYTAMAVNNKNRDLEFMHEKLSGMNTTLDAITASLSDSDVRLGEVERVLKETLRERVKLLYVNSDHILLETEDGTVLKVPMVKK